MDQQISSIKAEYSAKIASAGSLEALDELFLSLFGKNGLITLLPKSFPSLGAEELKRVGPAFNEAKLSLEEAVEIRRQAVREASYLKLDQESFDPEGAKVDRNSDITERKGYLHPNTIFEHQIVELFKKIGFNQFDAPHIDSDDLNFGLLNIPADHPARDLWDTLYLDYPQSDKLPGKLLLRTHTSNSQIRIMQQFDPPMRMMVLGRCFRYENLDARHEHTFDQFEIVYIDRGLSMAHLQYLSEYFLKSVLGKDTKVRLRPKYYPFVEPGVGIDGTCIFCQGKGCKVCGNLGWLELGGAGMIHPTVLKNGGIDPNIYSGIAWGPGLGRIMMLQNGIDDLRKFLSGDLEFIQGFGKDKQKQEDR